MQKKQIGQMPIGRAWRAWSVSMACAISLGLTACGGGGSGKDPSSSVVAQPASFDMARCSNTAQKSDLRSYMQDWYYFADKAPNPDPVSFGGNIIDYFYASLYTVNDRTVASDHWSYPVYAQAYLDYFESGKVLGFGVSTTLPSDSAGGDLVIQTVEAGSPAARAGLQRGQHIVAINDIPVSQLDNDQYYQATQAAHQGDIVTLKVLINGVATPVQLGAASYNVALVERTNVLASPSGRHRAGYIRLDGFVETAANDLGNALRSFNNDPSINSLIVDLRYNGGGDLDLSAWLVNLIVGDGHTGQLIGSLVYNNKHTDANYQYRFAAVPFRGWQTVYVLTGQDTCSASEFLINALRPYVNVVQIGGQTCGKPFGFNGMQLDAPCDGVIFNAENFEAFNSAGKDDYYAGMTPAAGCEAADDLLHRPGNADETLTKMALNHLDTGVCGSNTSSRITAQGLAAVSRRAYAASPRPSSLRNSMWSRPSGKDWPAF